jgi:hypothetical protein
VTEQQRGKKKEKKERYGSSKEIFLLCAGIICQVRYIYSLGHYGIISAVSYSPARISDLLKMGRQCNFGMAWKEEITLSQMRMRHLGKKRPSRRDELHRVVDERGM